MTAEQWRPVPGFEGRYEVSDHGRVRSLDRPVRCRSGKTRIARGKVLAPGTMNRFGHVSVAIGKGNSRCVHDLVLSAFVGQRPVGHEARHRDLDGSNNRLENLLWGTRGQNVQDVFAAGQRKVDEIDVRAIRQQRLTGRRLREIGEEFDISDSYVSDIARRKQYARVA